MGSAQSSTITECVSQLNEQIYNQLTSQQDTTDSVLNNVNDLNVNINDISLSGNCNIDFSQTITVNQKIKQIAKLTDINQVQSTLKNSVQNTLNSNSKAVSDFLSTTFNSQDNNENLFLNISNQVINNITNDQISSIVNFVDNLQQGNLDMSQMDCSGNATIISPQDQVVNSIVNNVSNLYTNNLMNNTEIADGVNKLSQQQTSENKGIGDAIAKVFSSMTFMVIGLVVVVLALIIFVPKIIDSLGGAKGITEIVHAAGPVAAAFHTPPHRRRLHMY